MMKRTIYKSMPSRRIGAAVYQQQNYFVPAVRALAFLIIALAVSYVAIMTFTVFNTAQRASYEKQISVKTAAIVDLEAKLSTLDKNITPVLATTKGFEEVNTVKYITTKPIRSAMSDNEMEL